MIKRWFERRRKRLVSDIAAEVCGRLSANHGWEKFLPPVVMRDTVYMVTENGTIYAMKYDEMIMQEIIQVIRH